MPSISTCPTRTRALPRHSGNKKRQQESHPFSDKYARAREIQAEIRADELLDIADDATNDYMAREAKSGKTFIVADHENIQRSKLRVDTRKWIAAKLLPKKYGDSPAKASDAGAKEQIAETVAEWRREAKDAKSKLREEAGELGVSEPGRGSPPELPSGSGPQREDVGDPSKDNLMQPT